MKTFIVRLRTEPAPPDPSRGEFAKLATQRVANLQKEIRDALEVSGLSSELEWMSEPGAMPLISIRCTPEAAERIRALPGVEAVFED